MLRLASSAREGPFPAFTSSFRADLASLVRHRTEKGPAAATSLARGYRDDERRRRPEILEPVARLAYRTFAQFVIRIPSPSATAGVTAVLSALATISTNGAETTKGAYAYWFRYAHAL
jgi:hypothetical protein